MHPYLLPVKDQVLDIALFIIGAIPTVLENMAPILAVARAMTTAVNEFVTMALGS